MHENIILGINVAILSLMLKGEGSKHALKRRIYTNFVELNIRYCFKVVVYTEFRRD